jgi:nitrogen regulatory protein P-II 1
MKKIEVIIKASKLDDVKDAVHSMGVQGMTVTEVKGLGGQKGHNEIYRGLEYVVDFVPQIKIETVVQSSIVDQLIEKVISATRTGAIGDGNLFYRLKQPYGSEPGKGSSIDFFKMIQALMSVGFLGAGRRSMTGQRFWILHLHPLAECKPQQVFPMQNAIPVRRRTFSIY